jgi:NAD(P)-dependent dehydrogenase (short-subunit alcohol dehydrogenase family)
MGHYMASKMGMLGLTRGLANEVGASSTGQSIVVDGGMYKIS